MKRLFVSFLIFFIISSMMLVGQGNKGDAIRDAQIRKLRDSLEAITYPIHKLIATNGNNVIIRIDNQDEWNALSSNLRKILNNGINNITIEIAGKGIIFGETKNSIYGWDYPEANIKIIGTRSKMQAFGILIKEKEQISHRNGAFYVLAYDSFNLDDIITDEAGHEISLKEEMKCIKGNIIKDQGEQDDLWKFKVELPNLTEKECADFYVLMTRDWTSSRHKVEKVEDGWLYYHLDSEDLHSDINPNVDWLHYQVRPRYGFINNPTSKGIHIKGGKIYIPVRSKYGDIRINKGGHILSFDHCHFNTLEITGFKLNGCGNATPFGIYNSRFEEGAFIHHNMFSNLSSLAIGTAFNENVSIFDNVITNTRIGAIYADGKNINVYSNTLSNIGWMLNSRAVTLSGENVHVFDNTFRDFNYAAIASGSRRPNSDGIILTFVIEHNMFEYTAQYSKNKLYYTLADGGAIYVGPQCTRGIIRYNVIKNYDGIHSNRGVFIDDGGKNMAIYGNLIINTENSYDIDLRVDKTFNERIPDHNTNNSVFGNILSGGYRFQERDAESNCMGGNNIMLGFGNFQNKNIELTYRRNDIALSGCQYKNNKIVIPVSYKEDVEAVIKDGFVRDYIKFK